MRNKAVLAGHLTKLLGGRKPAEDRSDDILDEIIVRIKQFVDDGEINELLDEAILYHRSLREEEKV
jgi:hypothetical protein